LSESELRGKVASLLAIAYETRDLHIAELFALERRHRRDALTLELQKLALVDARAKVSLDYTDLAEVKVVLTKRGFADEVSKYTKHRDAPIGCNIAPSDLAYVYDPAGICLLLFSFIPCRLLTSCTEVRTTRSCVDFAKDDGISVNRTAISV
jgi:hypothetical protein